MRRPYSFARGSHVPSSTINRIMDEATGLVRATGAPSDARAFTGEDGRSWTTVDAGLADGASVVVDASVDWRYRSLHGVFTRLTAAAQRSHGADAWKRNDPTQAIAVRTFDDAWTGAGCALSDGVPTISSGHFGIIVDELGVAADRAFLFADSENDGALTLYNDSGATLHAELRVWGAGASASAGTAPSVPGLLAGEVDTTDATWTTIAGCTATLAASSTVTFRGMVSAIRDDGTEGGGWSFSVRARRGASGATVVSSPTFSLADADDADFDVRVDLDGDDVVFQVRGDTGKNLTWRAEIDATESRI